MRKAIAMFMMFVVALVVSSACNGRRSSTSPGPVPGDPSNPTRITDLTVRVDDGSGLGAPLPDPPPTDRALKAIMKYNVPTSRVVFGHIVVSCNGITVGEIKAETNLSVGDWTDKMSFRFRSGRCIVSGEVRDEIGSDSRNIEFLVP